MRQNSLLLVGVAVDVAVLAIVLVVIIVFWYVRLSLDKMNIDMIRLIC